MKKIMAPIPLEKMLKDRLNTVTKALHELCELKILKDVQGDTPEYRERKGPAWERAFACFPEYKASTKKTAKRMKIIARDNYNREWVSDRLICTGISQHFGEKFVKALNEDPRETDDFYVLVDEDHKLYEGDSGE